MDRRRHCPCIHQWCCNWLRIRYCGCLQLLATNMLHPTPTPRPNSTTQHPTSPTNLALAQACPRCRSRPEVVPSGPRGDKRLNRSRTLLASPRARCGCWERPEATKMLYNNLCLQQVPQTIYGLWPRVVFPTEEHIFGTTVRLTTTLLGTTFCKHEIPYKDLFRQAQRPQFPWQ